MEFRWVALLALWTLLSGPIFGDPPGRASRARERAHAAPAAKAARQTTPRK